MDFNQDQNDDVVFYPFCPGIPWELDNRIIIKKPPTVDMEKIFHLKHICVLCPGYLIEALMLPIVKNSFERYNLKVERWIFPKYYEKFLSYFGIKTCTTKNSDIFSEHNRINKAVISYPSPFFMDRQDNIYYNILFNYGDCIDYVGNGVDRNYEPFYDQILKNLCLYSYNFCSLSIGKEHLRKICFNFLSKYGIYLNKPIVVIDNCNLSYKLSDGRVMISRCFSDNEIKCIGASLASKKYNCLVLSETSNVGYFYNNVYNLPAWKDLDFDVLISLLSCSSYLYSSDPNIYISAAMVGCGNIFAGGNFDSGWSLNDLKLLFTSRWIEKDEFDYNDLINFIR